MSALASSLAQADAPVVASTLKTINYHANKSYSKSYTAYSADQLALIEQPPPRSYAASVSPFIKRMLEQPTSRPQQHHENNKTTVLPWDPKTAPQSSSFYYVPSCEPRDISHSGLRVFDRDGVFVDSVAAGSVGEAAGLQAGDQIVFAHNRDITKVDEFILVINKIPGSIDIRVRRDGQEIFLVLARSSSRDRY